MLLEVIAFALVLSAFELVVIGMISPRYRLRLIKWEIPRLCRGGSRSLTFT